MPLRNASAFLAFFALVAATKTSTTARKLPPVPGKGTAPKSVPSCAPSADELAEGRVVHGLESAPAGRELLGRLVPGQLVRVGVGVAQDGAEVIEGGLHLLAAPVEAVVDQVLPAASSDRAQQRVLKQLDRGEAVLGAEAERRGAGRFDLPEVADKRVDRVAARGGCDPSPFEELRVEPQDVAAVSAGWDAVGAAVVHERLEDRGVHRRLQTFAREDRRDAADEAAAGIALDRLAGERLPDIGRVVALEPFRELDDRVGAGAAGDRAVNCGDARV